MLYYYHRFINKIQLIWVLFLVLITMEVKNMRNQITISKGITFCAANKKSISDVTELLDDKYIVFGNPETIFDILHTREDVALPTFEEQLKSLRHVRGIFKTYEEALESNKDYFRQHPRFLVFANTQKGTARVIKDTGIKSNIEDYSPNEKLYNVFYNFDDAEYAADVLICTKCEGVDEDIPF